MTDDRMNPAASWLAAFVDDASRDGGLDKWSPLDLRHVAREAEAMRAEAERVDRHDAHQWTVNTLTFIVGVAVGLLGALCLG